VSEFWTTKKIITMSLFTSAVRTDADGLPEDQYGNDTTVSDGDANSIALLPTNIEDNEAVVCTPDKHRNITGEDNIYNNPADRKKRKLLPPVALNDPQMVEVKKQADPRPNRFFSMEFEALLSDKYCPDCKHTTCHDLLYGDYCGFQAHLYAKNKK
jgi:hypothetical protein